MLADVRERAPEEACGLLAGKVTRVLQVFAITNELHSPVRFRMDPQEQWTAFEEIEKLGLELLAIYHSHPGGPAGLSPTDLAEAAYPGAIYLVWAPANSRWQCRGFVIPETGESVQEVPVIIE